MEPNLIQHNTTCVFCRCQLTVGVDPACPGDRLEKLLPLACCNRCGDFRHAVRPLEDGIKRICEGLNITRAIKSKQLKDIEKVARDSLVIITKSLMFRLCKFYRLTDCWEPEFPQLLFDKPANWKAILTYNENGLRTLKKLPEVPKPTPSRDYQPTFPDP